MIAGWVAEMQARWPGHTFRIYRTVEPDEVTIRFHLIAWMNPSRWDHGNPYHGPPVKRRTRKAYGALLAARTNEVSGGMG